MKKLMFFAALAAAAIVSYGGNIVHQAHAQTVTAGSQLTPAQTAALEQQLDVAKAELANLEMQAGMVPNGDGGTVAGTAMVTPTTAPTVAVTGSNGLTPAQVTAMKGTLSTLASMLTQLSASVATDNTLTASQQTAVANTLGSMTGILASMATTIQSQSLAMNTAPVSAPVAATHSTDAGSSPVAVNTQGSSNAGSAAQSQNSQPTSEQSSQPTVTVTTNPTPAATTPAPAQTAQASSFWGFTKAHWPTIVIVLLIIAILAILFWPEKETTVRTVSTNNAGAGKPRAPTPTVATPSQTTTTVTSTPTGTTVVATSSK